MGLSENCPCSMWLYNDQSILHSSASLSGNCLAGSLTPSCLRFLRPNTFPIEDPLNFPILCVDLSN